MQQLKSVEIVQEVLDGLRQNDRRMSDIISSFEQDIVGFFRDNPAFDVTTSTRNDFTVRLIEHCGSDKIRILTGKLRTKLIERLTIDRSQQELEDWVNEKYQVKRISFDKV